MIVFPYNPHSESARLLSKALGVKIMKNPSKYKGGVVLNWGNAKEPLCKYPIKKYINPLPVENSFLYAVFYCTHCARCQMYFYTTYFLWYLVVHMTNEAIMIQWPLYYDSSVDGTGLKVTLSREYLYSPMALLSTFTCTQTSYGTCQPVPAECINKDERDRKMQWCFSDSED